MPKLKTHKGAARRFYVTGTGKVMHRKGSISHLRSRKATRSLPTFVLGSRYCSTEARETSIAVPEDSDIFAPLVNCPSVESVAHSSTVLVNMEPDQPLPLRLVIQ